MQQLKNQIAMTMSYVLCFSTLISYFYWSSGLLTVTAMVICAFLSWVLLRNFKQSSPRPRSRSSTESFDVLFLTLLEGSGGGPWGGVYEASAVRSDAQASTFTPHGLADSPRAPSRPASPAHGKGPQVSCILNPLYCTFTAPFLCLDMFRYTDPYHCVTVARSNLQRPAGTAA